MGKVFKHIANAASGLDALIPTIDKDFAKAVEIAEKTINLSEVDVVFVNAPALAIKELGVGGFCPGPNNVYINIDPNFAIAENEIATQLLHEFHHAMRQRQVDNHRATLGDNLISEGMACLYEEEQMRKSPPIYVQVEISDEVIDKAKLELNNKDYNHRAWFFGSKDIPRWFGYTYGYKLVKDYAQRHNKSAAEMINIKAQEIIEA